MRKSDKENTFLNSVFEILKLVKNKNSGISRAFFTGENLSYFKNKISFLINRVHIIPTDIDSLTLYQTKSISQLFRFLLLECGEFVFQLNSLLLNSMVKVLQKTFPVLNIAEKTTLFIQFSHMIKFYATLCPKLAASLKRFLFDIFESVFYETDARIKLTDQLIELCQNNFDEICQCVLNCYSTCFFKNHLLFEIGNADIRFFEFLICKIEADQINAISDLLLFFDKLSLKNPTHFLFFSNAYFILVKRFWKTNGIFDKKFMNMWNSFFNRVIEISLKIFQGQRKEDNQLNKIELSGSILVLNILIRSDFDFFYQKMKLNCDKIDRQLREFAIKANRNQPLNVFIASIYRILQYEPGCEKEAREKNEQKHALFQEFTKCSKSNQITRENKQIRENLLSEYQLKHSKSQEILQFSELQVKFEKRTKANSCHNFSDNKSKKLIKQPKTEQEKHRISLFSKTLYSEFRNLNDSKIKRIKKQTIMQELKQKNDLQKLREIVSKKMERNGFMFPNKLCAFPKYFDYLKNIDTNFNIYFPNCFQMKAIHATEMAAVLNNFNLHKNLFLKIFKESATKIKSRVNPIDEPLAEWRISFQQFFHWILKSGEIQFQELNTIVVLEVFKMINSQNPTELILKTTANFQNFKLVLFQICLIVYRKTNPTFDLFDCFEMYLEQLKKSLKSEVWMFENDYLLIATADKELVKHYMKKTEQIKNGTFFLPKEFEIIEKQKLNKIETETCESEMISKLILEEILLNHFEMSMNKIEFKVIPVFYIKQIKTIFEEQRKDCQKCTNNKTTKELLKKISFESKIKPAIFAQKNTINLQNKQVELVLKDSVVLDKNESKVYENSLSLTIKIAIIEQTTTCRKETYFIGVMLEEMLRKVEIINSNKPNKVDFKTGQIVNSFYQKSISREINQKQREITSRIVFKQRGEKLKLALRAKSILPKTNDINFKQLAPIKALDKKLSYQLAQKKEIEEFKKDIQKKKELENQNQQKLEKEKQKKRIQEYKEFKEKELKNLSKFFEKLSIEKKDKTSPLQKKNSKIKIDSKQSAKIKDKLHEINEKNKKQNEIKKELFAKMINLNSLAKVFEKQKLQVLFHEFCKKNETGQILDEFWNFKEFLKFNKSFGILKNGEPNQRIKLMFESIRDKNRNENHFDFECFKGYLVQTSFILANPSGNFDNRIIDESHCAEIVNKILKKYFVSENKENLATNVNPILNLNTENDIIQKPSDRYVDFDVQEEQDKNLTKEEINDEDKNNSQSVDNLILDA